MGPVRKGVHCLVLLLGLYNKKSTVVITTVLQ